MQSAKADLTDGEPPEGPGTSEGLPSPADRVGSSRRDSDPLTGSWSISSGLPQSATEAAPVNAVPTANPPSQISQISQVSQFTHITQISQAREQLRAQGSRLRFKVYLGVLVVIGVVALGLLIQFFLGQRGSEDGVDFGIMLPTVAALGVALGISIFFVRSLVRDLSEITTLAMRVSQGDLTGPVTLEREQGMFHTPDERDELVAAIGAMVVNLRDVVAHIQSVSDAVSGASGELLRDSEGVREHAEIVVRLMDRINKGTDNQRNLVASTSRKLSDLATDVQRTARSAEDATRASVDTCAAAHAGGEAGRSSGERLKSVFGRIEAASDRVVQFTDKAAEINKIADVIQHVARQTNLLALNAAIEAARAGGEAGRGFSTVAEEVRKLADDTGRSAEQISTIIRGFNEEIRAIVVLMKESNDELRGGREGIDFLLRSLNNIVRAAEEGASKVDLILSISREQEKLAEDMVGAMGDIRNVAGDTYKAANEASTASEQQFNTVARLSEAARMLKDMSGELQIMVKRFRL